MGPTHQRLDAEDAAGRERHQRLVVKVESLALRQRVAQVGFDQLTGPQLGAHLLVEELIGVAPLRLAGVKREIGLLQQLVGVGRVVGEDRETDRRAGVDAAAFDDEGPAQRLDDAFGEVGRAAQVLDLGLHDGELVAAKARHRVGFTDRGVQAPGDALEQLVADVVAQRVVDVLEVIEVEQVQAHDVLVTSGMRRALAQAVEEQRAVGQVGQAVVLSEVLDALLGLLARRDVGRDAADRDDLAARIAHRELDREQGVLAVVEAHFFLLLDDLAGLDDGAVLGDARIRERLREQLVRGLAPGRLVGLAADFLIDAIDEDVAAVGALERDRVGRIVDDRAKAFLVLA